MGRAVLRALHQRGQEACAGPPGAGSRALAAAYRAALRTVVRTLMARQRFAFPPRAVDPWWAHWGWRLEVLMRWWEPESVAWCASLVRSGMTVLDIGAHVGYYARLLAELVGPAGRVLAFEPFPENMEVLRYNLSPGAYARVELFETAVSDRPGEAVLHLSPGSSNHSLVPGYTALRGTLPVKTISLDSFLEERGILSVDFAKIDVEGAEPAVIAGMENTVRRSSRLSLLVECNPAALRCGGSTPADLLVALEGLGLRVWSIAPDASLQAVRRDGSDRVGNLLCRKGAA